MLEVQRSLGVLICRALVDSCYYTTKICTNTNYPMCLLRHAFISSSEDTLTGEATLA